MEPGISKTGLFYDNLGHLKFKVDNKNAGLDINPAFLLFNYNNLL